MVKFVKEFESYILSNKSKESIQTLIPYSESEIYLKLIDLINSAENEFPKKEIDDLINIFEKKTSPESKREVKLLALLKEYDISSTNICRKDQILREIKDMFFNNYKYDYQRPFNNTQSSSTVNNESSEYPSSISDIFNPSKFLNQIYTDDLKLETFFQINEKYVPSLIEFDKLSQSNFDKIVQNQNLLKFPLHEFDDMFIKKLSNFLDRYLEKNKVFPNNIPQIIKKLTLSQIQMLSSLLTYRKLDRNIFISEIVTREYMDEVTKAQNQEEKYQCFVKIYEYLKGQETKYHKLISDVLINLMEVGITLNRYDINYFFEYLKKPSSMLPQYEISYKMKRRIQKQERFTICNMSYKNNSEEFRLISKYLRHFFFYDLVKYEELSKYFNEEFLKREYYTSLLLKGEDNKEFEKILGLNIYESLIRKTEITICEHNPASYKINEPVILELDLKNVYTLYIKIFKINTENYYFHKRVPINTNISLEGFIATYEEIYSFNEKPQTINRKKFEFDKIPKERGLFIIEFIGGGISSRAIIKKGGLSLITRSTKLGKMIFVLDEETMICNSKTTGIWLKDELYAPSTETGAILIPYKQSKTIENVVLIHEGFAEIAKLEIDEEVYTLKGCFLLNHESLIMGNTAKVICRPYLLVNNRPTNLNLLKNSKISISMIKKENEMDIPITNIHDKLEIDTSKEIIVDFQVPAKLNCLEFEFEALIWNHSKEKNEKFSFKNIFSVNIPDDDRILANFYLRKIKDNYAVSLLGKNGEPKIRQQVTLKYQNIINNLTEHSQLQTNENGEIYLGKLQYINKIILSTFYLTNNVIKEFIIPSKNKYMYPNQIDILLGDKINLPFNNSKIGNHNLSFISITQGTMQIKQNLIDELKLINVSEDQNKSLLEIIPKKIGRYILCIKESESNIEINVHSGKIWNTPNFLILKDRIIENSEYYNPIRVERIELKKENSKNTNIYLKLNKDAINARVHVFAFHFMNSFSHSFFNAVKQSLIRTSHSSHSYQVWNNFYLSNKILNEETQYVLERKNIESFMGNTLEKPSLLLKRQFIRDTRTNEQHVSTGTEYNSKSADIISSHNVNIQTRNQEKDKLIDLKLSYIYNFLADCPLILTNLKPNKEGVVQINEIDLKGYTFIQIIGLDDKSVTEEFIQLKLDEENTEIDKKDLRLTKTLDLEKSYSEIRNTELLLMNKEFIINDITSTNFKIIDNLDKLANYYILLLPKISETWNKFKFLLKLHEYSFEQQKKNISQYFSYELSLFLYFKHPNIFSKIVLPIIRYKTEKRLIDYFLMGDRDSLVKYCSPKRLSTLNTIEKVILVYFFKNDVELSDLSIKINKLIKLESEGKVLNSQNHKILFNIMMNMKLKDELNFLEEEINKEIPIPNITQNVLNTQPNLNADNLNHNNNFSNSSNNFNFAENQINSINNSLTLGSNNSYFPQNNNFLSNSIQQLEQPKLQQQSNLFGSSFNNDTPNNSLFSNSSNYIQNHPLQHQTGLFGSSLNNVPQTTNIFSNQSKPNHIQSNQLGGSLFNQVSQTPFSQNSNNKGLFESANNLQIQPNTSNHFSFGNSHQPSFSNSNQSLFGNPNSQSNNQNQSLFGNSNSQSNRQNLSLFCNSNSQSNVQNQSLFGNSNQPKQIVTTIDPFLFGNNIQPLNNNLNTNLSHNPHDLRGNFGQINPASQFGQNNIIDSFSFIESKHISSVADRGEVNSNKNLSKEIGNSKEYRETHFYDPSHNLLCNLFWSDLAEFFISNPNGSLSSNFLTKNVLLKCDSFADFIFRLSFIDLPLSSVEHTYLKSDARGLKIKSQSNMIIFTQEIKETKEDIKSEIMISQHLSYNNNKEKNVINQFLVNEIYRHETIVTNISSKILTFELLIQIPEGSIPVFSSEYTRTINVSLNKFETRSFETYFYFPFSGQFSQYAPNASIEGIVVSRGNVLNFDVIQNQEKKILESLDDILISGTKVDIINYLEKQEIIKRNDLQKIYWLLKEKEFFNSIINVLSKKMFYDEIIWSFGFYHINEKVIKEFLDENSLIKNILGPNYKSSLINVDEINNHNILNHLDYNPVINARVHRIGKEDKLDIMNNQLRETYEKFILFLIKTKSITSKYWLRLCYYLILQDRIEEALSVFSKINQEEFNSINSLQLQYDYLSSYLDFYTGYPNFSKAKEIYKKMKDFPVLHWQELFEEVNDQIYEYEEKEKCIDIDSIINLDKKTKQQTKNDGKHDTQLSFVISDKSLKITYSNLSKITIKFYLIDLEILFSRTPFIQQSSDDFSFVEPNFVEEIKVENQLKELELIYPINQDYALKNMFIEVSSQGKKCFETHFSNNLNVSISENIGEVKVVDKNHKPLNKVYVKCFARMNGNSVKFFKDGYTDLRGRFNFLGLNTNNLGNLNKFALFILHPELGSVIKECSPPSNLMKDSSQKILDYDHLHRYKQEMKQLWRVNNSQKK